MTRVLFPNVARRVAPGFATKKRRAAETMRHEFVEQLVGLLLVDGPQDRHMLALRMGMSDRKVRLIAEAARLRGELVIFARFEGAAGGAYKIAETRAEYEAWKRAEITSRLGSFGAQLRATDVAADRHWPLEQARWIA